MCKTIKITNDDKFVWRKFTAEQAKAFFKADIDSLYALYDDNTESLIHDVEEIMELDARGVEFGIEVGFVNYREQEQLEEALKNHDFTYGRSDDMSYYKAGLESMKKISELKTCVDQNTFVHLWNKYAPKELRIKP